MRNENEGFGLESLLGETVTLMCANHIYAGKLICVGKEDILLENPYIVYETGPWDKPGWTDAQKLPSDTLYVRIAFIESYGVLK